VTLTETVILWCVEGIGSSVLGILTAIWVTRRHRRRIVARELADWHHRISSAAEHGTVDVLAVTTDMWFRVEALAGNTPACTHLVRSRR
jgi:hypothetical protein